MSIPLKIFIGFDKRETIAFNVLSHSIFSNASRPVSICPLVLDQLREVHTRERHPLQSTDFSFTRFLVPYLSDYQGWSLFMDCDMLVMDDICKLWDQINEKYAIQVVKHDHKPKETTKFLSQPQSAYEKKNWSSVMLFNNAKCRALSPEYVDSASGLELHQFKWLEDDSLIGDLPIEWNYLVDCGLPETKPANVHYTLGGPYFSEYRKCGFSAEWNIAKEQMLYVERRRR